jgi:hypothetical protein
MSHNGEQTNRRKRDQSYAPLVRSRKPDVGMTKGTLPFFQRLTMDAFIAFGAGQGLENRHRLFSSSVAVFPH